MKRTQEWWEITPRRGYFRHFRTAQEIRRWFKDLNDGVKLRRKRNPYSLEPWNYDKIPSCYVMKSWKKLAKKRKQWM